MVSSVCRCMSMIIMSPASSSMPMVIVTSTTSSMPTDLMELDTIVCIIFRSIKSDIREIIPYREECSIDNIRKKELIKHEDDTDWDNGILFFYDKIIKP